MDTILGIIITSIFGIISVLLTNYFNQPKSEAETEKTRIESASMVAEEWADYAKELKDRMTALNDSLIAAEKKIAELEAKVETLQKELHKRNTALVDMLRTLWVGMTMLLGQIKRENLVPDWEPDEHLIEDIEKELEVKDE